MNSYYSNGTIINPKTTTMSPNTGMTTLMTAAAAAAITETTTMAQELLTSVEVKNVPTAESISHRPLNSLF